MTTISELSQKATQRGARMQIMRRWMISYGVWDVFIASYPQAATWFSNDGVPVQDDSVAYPYGKERRGDAE